MQDNLSGIEGKAEIVTPEDGDGAVLASWDAYRAAWLRRAHLGDAMTAKEHRALVKELSTAAAKIIKHPVRSLEGIRAKMILMGASGPDSDVFLRRYADGQPWPELLAFNDFSSSQLVDCIAAVERLMAAEGGVH